MKLIIVRATFRRVLPFWFVVQVIAGLLVFSPALIRGQGITVVQHSGLLNPLTEGFVVGLNGTPLVGPVTNDMGHDAWAIRAPYPSGLNYAQYFSNQNLSESDWVLSVTLRILTPSISMSGTFSTGVATGTDFFSLFFGAQQDGDQSIRVLGDGGYTPDYILEGAGSGYHNYELRYSSANQTADLWVDGIAIYSDLQGTPSTASPYLLWAGSNPFSTLGAIEARWDSVELSVVPEPSTAALLLASAILIGLLRTRRCSEPGHHAPVAIGAARGPGR